MLHDEGDYMITILLKPVKLAENGMHDRKAIVSLQMIVHHLIAFTFGEGANEHIPLTCRVHVHKCVIHRHDQMPH